ncbi:MAG: tetratricopeptide repeat protein [Planctomycetaceae bacterium]
MAEQELADLTANAPKAKKQTAAEEEVEFEHEVESLAADSGSDIQLASAEVPVSEGTSLAKAANSDIDTLLKEGQQFESKGEFEQAARIYKQVLATHPVNGQAHHRLGVIADLNQNFVEAEQHYRMALQSNPLDPELLSDLGYSYLLQNRYADSQSYLNQAIQMKPDHTRALNNLGLLYARNGNRDQALAMFRQTSTEAEAQRKLAMIAPSFNASQTQLVTSNTMSNMSATPSGGVVNANAQAVQAPPVGTSPFGYINNQAQTQAQTPQNMPAQNLAAQNAMPGSTPPAMMASQDFQALAPVPQRQNQVAPNQLNPSPGSGQTTVYNNSQSAPVNQSNPAAPMNSQSQRQPFVFNSQPEAEATSAPADTSNATPNSTLPNGARVPFVFGAETTSTSTPNGMNPSQLNAGNPQGAAQANWNQGQQPNQNPGMNISPQNNSAGLAAAFGMTEGEGIQPVGYNAIQNNNLQNGLNGYQQGTMQQQNPLNVFNNNALANGGLPAINPQAGWGTNPQINPGMQNTGMQNTGMQNLNVANQQQQQYDAWGNPITQPQQQPAMNMQQQMQQQVFPQAQAQLPQGQMPQNQVFPSNTNAVFPQGNSGYSTGGQQYQYQQPVITPGTTQNAFGGSGQTVKF